MMKPWVTAQIPLIVLPLLLAACDRRQPADLPSPPLPSNQTRLPAATHTLAPTPAPAAARVNGEGILLAEYQAGLAQLQSAQQELGEILPPCLLAELIPEPGEGQGDLVLEGLVADTLLAQAAVLAGFNLPEADLQSRWDEIARRAGGEAAFGDWLRRMGYTEELFRTELRRSMAAAWQRDRILAAAPEKADQVRARQLLFTDRSLAEEALAELQVGEAGMADLAFERDPATGGDLGWFPCNYLSQPAVEEAAFSLSPGEYSPVIETALGYHILLVTARETDRLLNREARLAVQRSTLAGWVAEQRAAARVEIMNPSPPAASASQTLAGGPWYAVQEGESLYWLTAQLGLTAAELLQANPQANPNLLAAGAELVVPGRGSFPIFLTLGEVATGDRLESLARQRLLPPALLARLNRWTSPAEAYTGSPLVLPDAGLTLPLAALPALEPGQTLLELAACHNLNPWLIRIANQPAFPSGPLPGEGLVVPDGGSDAGAGAPGIISGYEIDPLPLLQGSTVRVRVRTHIPAQLSGWLDGRELHFFELGENDYAALQGVHAMAEPGVVDFSLTAVSASGQADVFDESLLLTAGDYQRDPPLTVDPATIDPAITGPEEDLIRSITAPATSEKLWQGSFGVPVERWNCTPSGYGSRRSYNGSGYIFFHGGLDYGLCDNPNIFAPAAGKVVYTGALTVRGNATLIDHGWGIYSGIWHQSEIYVRAGDWVEAGQLIGKIGATGRVTGEHLHWEIWAGGVQVDPVAWLGHSFP